MNAELRTFLNVSAANSLYLPEKIRVHPRNTIAVVQLNSSSNGGSSSCKVSLKAVPIVGQKRMAVSAKRYALV